MEPREIFPKKRGELLGNYGYEPDPGRVELTDEAIVFYHYTHRDRVEHVLDTGLHATRRASTVEADLEGHFVVEGFLEPLPVWVVDNPYFGDLGSELNRLYLGSVALRVTVPADSSGLFVRDYAHHLEGKHMLRRGGPALHLGYHSGEEACLADVHSGIPMREYQGGHVAPTVAAIRKGEGIAIPRECIAVCETQRLAEIERERIASRASKQIEEIDKLVYAVARYWEKNKRFPQSFNRMMDGSEDLRRHLFWPKYSYALSGDLLLCNEFETSPDGYVCTLRLDKDKVLHEEILRKFRRPNMAMDTEALTYRISRPWLESSSAG